MIFQIYKRDALIGQEEASISEDNSIIFLSIKTEYISFCSRTYIEFDKKSRCLKRYNKVINDKFIDYIYKYEGINHCKGILNENTMLVSMQTIVPLELLYFYPVTMYNISQEYQCIDLYNMDLLKYGIINSKDNIYYIVGLNKILVKCKNKVSREIIMPTLRFKLLESS